MWVYIKDCIENEIGLDKIKERTVKSLALSIVGAVVLLALNTWSTVRVFNVPLFDKEDTYNAVILVVSVYYCILYLLLIQLIPHSFYSVIYVIDLLIAKVIIFFTGFHIDETDNHSDILV